MKLVRLELARISLVGEIVDPVEQMGRSPATSTIEDPRGFVAAWHNAFIRKRSLICLSAKC